jgi:hypothetical protein
MLETTCREIEYRLHISRARKDAHIEVVQHSAVLILKVIKLSELRFYFPYAMLFYFFRFENCRPRKLRQ